MTDDEKFFNSIARSIYNTDPSPFCFEYCMTKDEAKGILWAYHEIERLRFLERAVKDHTNMTKCQCGADIVECYTNRIEYGVHLNPMGGE